MTFLAIKYDIDVKHLPLYREIHYESAGLLDLYLSLFLCGSAYQGCTIEMVSSQRH